MSRLRHHSGEQAFTLVELLTVIGIIAMLIALLLPTLSRAKEEAKFAQCQINLRTIYNAAQIHMIDHQGFLPAAGWHFDPPGGVVNPRGLNDERRTRYIYYDDGGIQRPVPITVALAMSLGVKVRLDSRAAIEEDMQKEELRKYFRCPSQEESLRGLSQKSSEPWEGPKDWSSYVFNEAVIGLRERRPLNESTLGLATRVKRPTTVMFAMDGRPRNQEMDNWLMVFDKGPEDTLWDFQQLVTVPNTGYGHNLLDFTRHRYRAGTVFMDGHVERINMTRNGLDAVGISKGVRE
jgi:type II secretory pathway pseudopilin PulG